MEGGIRASVGIATHMRPGYLDDLLARLAAQTRAPDEVVVVDDSRDDRTRKVVEDHRRGAFEGTPTDVVYERMANEGTNQQDARNRIVELASGDLLCFLDDDTVPVHGWLEATLSAYRSDPAIVGVGGPAIRTDRDLEPVEDVVSDPPARNRVSEYGEVVDASGHWVPEDPVYTDVLRGANMTFEADALRAVGGFDSAYGGPAIFEEWDLMVRVARACGDLLYHPDALVYHVEAPSGGSRATDKSDRPGTYWYARNSVLFRKKLYGDVLGRSLARLALRGTDSGISPVWRRLARLGTGDAGEYYWLRGYVDGLLFESPEEWSVEDATARADETGDAATASRDGPERDADGPHGEESVR